MKDKKLYKKFKFLTNILIICTRIAQLHFLVFLTYNLNHILILYIDNLSFFYFLFDQIAVYFCCSISTNDFN